MIQGRRRGGVVLDWGEVPRIRELFPAIRVALLVYRLNSDWLEQVEACSG